MSPEIIVSLNERPVQRPDEPRHFMQIIALAYPITAELAGCQVAYSHQALMVQEVGHALYPPVIYFPQDAVLMSYLSPSGKSTECPLKGVTEYFDVSVGNKTFKNAAWMYERVYDFDERLISIERCVAFDLTQVEVRQLIPMHAKIVNEQGV